jgi:hypothetical protein
MEVLIALALVIIIVLLSMLMKTVGHIATKLNAIEKKLDDHKQESIGSEAIKPKQGTTRPPAE